MTIALGLLASDGVVIAADTEISTSGEVKGKDTKLVAATQQIYGSQTHAAIGVAGAGSWGYFQGARLKVLEIILNALGTDPGITDARMDSHLSQYMQDFYVKHVQPFQKQKNPPDLQILAGVWNRGRPTLWSSEKNMPYQSLDFDAIGIGGTFARTVLNGYYRRMPVDSAALLAIYVMMLVKENVASCGQESQLIVFREGVDKYYVPGELLKECERVFEDHYVPSQTKLMHFAVGLSNDESVLGLHRIRDECDKLRQAIRDTNSWIPPT